MRSTSQQSSVSASVSAAVLQQVAESRKIGQVYVCNHHVERPPVELNLKASDTSAVYHLSS